LKNKIEEPAKTSFSRFFFVDSMGKNLVVGIPLHVEELRAKNSIISKGEVNYIIEK